MELVKKIWTKIKWFLLGQYSCFRKCLLGCHTIGILTDTWNGLLVVDHSDTFLGRMLACAGEYDRQRINMLRSFVGPQSRVLVVGAHVGSLAIPLSKSVSHVTAIEPNPKTFRLLSINVLLNHAANIRLCNIAAAEAEGVAKFSVNRMNTGGSRILPQKDCYECSCDREELVSVRTVSLDSELQDEEFDLVVIDVEGYEANALKGMQRILANCRYLYLEVVPDNMATALGVSPSALLPLIPQHFDVAEVLGLGGKTRWKGRDFPKMLQHINKLSPPFGGADVFFCASKEIVSMSERSSNPAA